MSAVRCVLFVDYIEKCYKQVAPTELWIFFGNRYCYKQVAPTELILGLVGVLLQTGHPYGVSFGLVGVLLQTVYPYGVIF